VLIQIFIAARQPAFFMADIYEYYVPPTSMEPLLPEENSRDLEDLVGDFFKEIKQPYRTESFIKLIGKSY